MQTDTSTGLIALLTLLITSGAAGKAGSWLFDWLRSAMPRPTAAEWRAAPRIARLGWALLWSPGLAHIAVFVLTAAIAGSLAGLLELLTGGGPAVAASAMLSVIISQIVHRWGLPTTPTMHEVDMSDSTTTTRPEGA